MFKNATVSQLSLRCIICDLHPQMTYFELLKKTHFLRRITKWKETLSAPNRYKQKASFSTIAAPTSTYFAKFWSFFWRKKAKLGLSVFYATTKVALVILKSSKIVEIRQFRGCWDGIVKIDQTFSELNFTSFLSRKHYTRFKVSNSLILLVFRAKIKHFIFNRRLGNM